MANKRLRFRGQGYGSIPASIVATIDGVVVFTGEVPTLDQTTFVTDAEAQAVLFTAMVDATFSGTKPVSIQVTEGTVVFAQTEGNLGADGPNEWVTQVTTESDSRSNVTIAGASVSPTPGPGDSALVGDWHYTVKNPDTITFDQSVRALILQEP
jgi:hypothetical protein